MMHFPPDQCGAEINAKAGAHVVNSSKTHLIVFNTLVSISETLFSFICGNVDTAQKNKTFCQFVLNRITFSSWSRSVLLRIALFLT